MQKVKSILLTTVVCVLIALICLFGYLLLQNVSAEIFIQIGWETNHTVDLFTNGLVYAIIFYGILPPIIEEFVFRFLICRGLQLTKLPKVLIILISAIIFALYHWSWSQLVYQLIMGIILAWIFIRSNNLLWTILIHLINNVFIVSYTYIAGNTETEIVLNAGNILLAYGLAIITTVLVVILIKKGIPNAERQ